MAVTQTSDAVDRDALIARARAIRPMLERNAAQTDSLRRLPDEVVGALRDNGLCRLMVPKRFGGSQTSIRTYIEVMAEIGQGSVDRVGGQPHQRLRMACRLVPRSRAAGRLGRRSGRLDCRIARAKRHRCSG